MMNIEQHCASYDVLSRDTLQQTFEILRTFRPSIALEVRNNLAAPPLAQLDDQQPHSDYFTVQLRPETLRDLLIALSALMEQGELHETQEEHSISTQALIRDWLKYAKSYLN